MAWSAGVSQRGRMLAAHEVTEPGVWLPEQAVSAEAFFTALERLGWRAGLES